MFDYPYSSTPSAFSSLISTSTNFEFSFLFFFSLCITYCSWEWGLPWSVVDLPKVIIKENRLSATQQLSSQMVFAPQLTGDFMLAPVPPRSCLAGFEQVLGTPRVPISVSGKTPFAWTYPLLWLFAPKQPFLPPFSRGLSLVERVWHKVPLGLSTPWCLQVDQLSATARGSFFWWRPTERYTDMG